MMKRGVVSIVAGILFAFAASAEWKPKFYRGLEADGEVRLLEKGYRDVGPCVELVYRGGAKKFGAEQRAEMKHQGLATWTVTAECCCANGGEAGVAMEFFDVNGGTLGVRQREGVRPTGWTTNAWTFVAPENTRSASVHLLSLATGSVRFASVVVSSRPGGVPDELPISARPLPVTWSRDWNGGYDEFHSFAEAPLPLAFHFKGNRSVLKKPWFELDIPADLELLDAYPTHIGFYGTERPTEDVGHDRNGVAYRRLTFWNLRVFDQLLVTYGYERKTAFVIGPKEGVDPVGKTYPLYWRIGDANCRSKEYKIDMSFLRLPTGLRKPKNFGIISWDSEDRLFSNDAAASKSLRAYEEAGLAAIGRPYEFSRREGLFALLKSRPVRWQLSAGLQDFTFANNLYQDRAECKALNVQMDVSTQVQSWGRLCTEYFIHDEAFQKYLKKLIFEQLDLLKVEDGEMVHLDYEPWNSRFNCVCDRCRAAFSKEMNLPKVPTIEDLNGLSDEWAEFRCRQTEQVIASFCRAIRDYNPTLRIGDYDYIVEFGTPNAKAFLRGCAKDSARNEKWFDFHICSYYHAVGLRSFQMMRNNTRHLKKPYLPLGAISGYTENFLRGGEVLTPRQLRQFVLAAFVNGCCGCGFYSGRHLDALQMVAFMKARDQIAVVEDYPWGKTDGKLTVESDDKAFVFASTQKGDVEVVAFFNYDATTPAKATVKNATGGFYEVAIPTNGETVESRVDMGKGVEFTVPAEGVRFVSFRKIK